MDDSRSQPFGQEDLLSISLAVKCFSFAAIAAQGWDWIVALSDEVEYLWRGQFTFVKGLYFSARYGMMVLQIIDQYLYIRFQEAPDYSHPLTCARIFVYKSIVGQVGMSLIEAILLIRVYALYNRNFKARFFLLGVFTISTAFEITAASIVIRTVLDSPACVPPEVDRRAGWFYGVGAGICQIVVFLATSINFFGNRRKRTPLMTLMFKEGMISFLLVIGLVAVVFVYEIVRNTYTRSGKGTTTAVAENALFSWYLALLSIAGSRLILNMRTVFVKHRLRHQSHEDAVFSNGESNSVCLTTLRSLDE